MTAIDRVRAMLATFPDDRFACETDDLRALLDAYDTALARLSPFAHSECDDAVAGYVCACEQCLAFRFLKQEGRR